MEPSGGRRNLQQIVSVDSRLLSEAALVLPVRNDAVIASLQPGVKDASQLTERRVFAEQMRVALAKEARHWWPEIPFIL